MRSQVFISYSHKDVQWLEQLQEQLKPLEREGKVTRWDDTKIESGQKWEEEIKGALASAKVAVLLVSSAFLASDFIADNELPPLLEAAERDGAVILPVLVSPSRYVQTKSISQFQSVNPPSKTLLEMTEGERARVWVKLTEDIEAALAAGPPQSRAGGGAPSDEALPRTAEGPPQHEAAARKHSLEVNLLNGAEVKNTRAGNVTGVAGDAGAELEGTVGVFNESVIDGSALGDITGVVLKGEGKKPE